MGELELRLLGPLEAVRGDASLALGGPKQRAALALLALRAGAVVPTDRLVEALWGDEPPPTAQTALQGHVSRLRRLLGPDAILTRPPGYLLAVDPEDVDLARFERLVADARGLAPLEREAALRQALGLWRGPALADLAAEAGVAGAASRLDEQRLAAWEDLFEVQLELARHVELVADLESFTHAEPLRERPVGQLMLALYRSGRQVDALDAYRRYRQQLNEALGLEPSPALRELERRVLAHDPALAPPAALDRRAPARRLPLTVVALGFVAEPAGDQEPDLEAYGRVTAQAREAVRLVLERHGATVERAGGSVLLGLFGIPAPNEDDARRAVQAAGAALEAVDVAAAARFGVRLSARAGVASGEAFGGESPAIEQALRLQADATEGAVLVDAATPTRARGRMLRLDRPLAGRGSERQRLHEAYERSLRERCGGLVTVLGPAGIGKTRLVADLLASVRPGTRVLRARCLSYGDGVGLVPAIDLVRAAADLSEPVREDEARSRLAQLADGDGAGAAAVDRLLGLLGLAGQTAHDDVGWAVRRLVEGLARRSPVLVHVDDLHWAAPAFVEVVERLAEPCDAPLLVVATARVSPSERLGGQEIRLDPLDQAACAEVLAGLLAAGEVEPTALAKLVEASGGNPLFLEELAVDLRDAGQLVSSGGVWRLEGSLRVPPTIQSLIAARLERLPEPERELIARASVIGRTFAVGALAELADYDVADRLTALLAAELVQPSVGEPDCFEFRHLLIRDAAYAALPLELRARLHGRHAAWLASSAVAAPLEREALAVYHLDQAHRARAALAPGDSAVAVSARELAGRAAALGRTLLGGGDARAAAAVLARARELDPDEPLVALELGRAHFDVGDFAAADAAFAAVGPGPGAERARLGRLEVRLHTDPSCDLEAAAREIDDALEALRDEGDLDGVSEGLLARAYVSLVRGRAAELGAILEQALDVARRAGRARAETWVLFLVCATCWYGPLPVDDGIRRCEQALGDARGLPNVQAAALQALAVLRAMRGEPDEARTLVASSRAIRREVGQEVGAAASAIDAGIVELLAGDHAAAERVLRDGHAALERLGETGYFSTVASLLAEAVEAQGRVEEARALAARAAAAAGKDDVVSQIGWRCTEARALSALGERDAAERVAREAVALADTTDFSLARAQAWTTLAEVARAGGDPRASADARGRAAALLEQKGCAPQAIAAWTRASRI